VGGGLHLVRRAPGGRTGAPQRSTELLRLDEDKDLKRYLGWATGLGCWAGLGSGLVGCGQVSYFFFFFCFSSFLLFPVFCFGQAN
jgi:hypothetical protein